MKNKPFVLIIICSAYLLLQYMVDYFEIIYIPVIPQLIFLSLGLVVGRLLSSFKYDVSVLLMMLPPVINIAIANYLYSEMDSIYISFLAINCFFYAIASLWCIFRRSKSPNLKP